jgi:hypothetical protein
VSSPSVPPRQRPRPGAAEPLRAARDPINGPTPNRQRPPRERRYRKAGPVARVLNAYGWRAYAIPVLAVLTVVALIYTFSATTDVQTTEDAANYQSRNPNPGIGKAIVGAPTGKPNGPVPGAGQLPEGDAYTAKGAGTWHVVPGSTAQVGYGKQHVFTYMIAVEDGIDMGGLGGDKPFATMVDRTLANPQSWTHDDQIGFRRIDKGTPDFTISLTSPMTTRSACGYQIPLESSCFNGELGRVVINLARWVRGATAYEGDISAYRQYQINHEVGHGIGYAQHVPCPKTGDLAPIMMQQSFGVKNRDIFVLEQADGYDNDFTCRPNAWPYPSVH